MDYGNGELCHLLHAERVSSQFAVSRFAEPNVEERFVRALHRGFRRETCELRHHANEPDGGHAGHVGIVFRHVADLVPDFPHPGPDVQPKNPGCSFRRRVKSHKRVNQRRFTRAIGSEQTNAPAGKPAVEIFQDRPPAELHALVFQLNEHEVLYENEAAKFLLDMYYLKPMGKNNE